MTEELTQTAKRTALNSDNSSPAMEVLSGASYRLRDLPRQTNQVPWQIDPARAALLVHDMQKYFVRCLPDEPRQDLVGNIQRMLDWARSRRVPVLFTAQPGNMTPEQRGLLHDFWGPGMKASEEDRAILPELKPLTNEASLTKWRYSAFSRTRFAEHLSEASRDQLIITGVFASIGVQATAVDSYSIDIETFVPQDAVADFSAERHSESMAYISRSCARVVTTEEAVGDEQ